MARTGRPTDYRPEYCAIVIDEMRKGSSIEELVLTFDICKDTIYKWIERHPDFADAIKRGRALSEAWWRREGRESLRDKDFNSGLWFMNMKNRHGWADKQHNETAITFTQEEWLKGMKD